jgi:hypothetical protein
MVVDQINDSFIFQCFLVNIGSVFEEEFDYFVIQLPLTVIHLETERTVEVQQRITVGFVHHPIHICAMVDQKVRNDETDFRVLKGDLTFRQSEKDDSQWGVTECIGLIYFCISQNQ